jgi:hypothetical protein
MSNLKFDVYVKGFANVTLFFLIYLVTLVLPWTFGEYLIQINEHESISLMHCNVGKYISYFNLAKQYIDLHNILIIYLKSN